MSSIYGYQAKKCFEENLRRFGDAKSHPEKHNLYSGLANLAQALSDLTGQLEKILHDLRQIRG